ncbi:MAG TPA: alpha-glucosidase/alpha-galactosidase [Actinomycetota bacterium]|jgi:alpha-galactosidase
MLRVTIIGAGSVEFTRNVVADLCSYEELHGSVTFALHDIDENRLAYAHRAAESIVRRTGARYALEAHRERRPALEGADYAINEIQVGGYAATVTDFEIPKKYGLRQTIGDTLGIGGIMRGLRTIPVVVEIGEDMHELCPDALLLNYTNPMAMVPWGVYAGSPFHRVVGVCHSVRDTHQFLAKSVRVPEDDIAFRTAGFNHQAFVYEFRRLSTGEDLYPRLREVVDADPEGLGRRVRVEIFKRFGYFPTESSEHSSEYVPWFLKHDEMVDRYRILVDDYIFRSDENLVEWEETKAALDRGEELDVEPSWELASEIIRSLETGEPREVYGNVRNGGLIEGLPDDACVEVPCLVDKNGVQPTRIGPIPTQTLALNRTFVNVAELTVRAALERRRDLVYQAALVDPNAGATLTPGQIVEMCDELIQAHGDLLPEGIRAA